MYCLAVVIQVLLVHHVSHLRHPQCACTVHVYNVHVLYMYVHVLTDTVITTGHGSVDTVGSDKIPSTRTGVHEKAVSWSNTARGTVDTIIVQHEGVFNTPWREGKRGEGGEGGRDGKKGWRRGVNREGGKVGKRGRNMYIHSVENYVLYTHVLPT